MDTVYRVPTYYGERHASLAQAGQRQEFDTPILPVLVCPSDGLRIILGSEYRDDLNAPDIQIERRPNGWAIFLHPVGASDPSGYVYFIDDGRSFVVPEAPCVAAPPIAIVESLALIPVLDQPGTQ